MRTLATILVTLLVLSTLVPTQVAGLATPDDNEPSEIIEQQLLMATNLKADAMRRVSEIKARR